MKTVIIGDIHGCNEALRRLLSTVAPDPETDRLILLGDLFDRGPDSWEVWQTVQQLQRDYGERFTLLRGNHEDYLLREKLTLGERIVWMRVGRKATETSFKRNGARMEDAVPWIREHTSLFFRQDGLQCVHAGIKVDPIEANDRNTLLHDHELVPQNRYSGPLTITGHIALPNPTWFAGDGKTAEKLPYQESRPLPERGVICIDTGCGKGGPLTAMTVENGSYRLDGASA